MGKLSRGRRSIIFITIASIVSAAAYFTWVRSPHPGSDVAGQHTENTVNVSSVQTPTGSIVNFSPSQFHDLYDGIFYPNTQELVQPPAIIGDSLADQRIQTLAAKRGYSLKSLPVSPILKTGEKNLLGDDLLQEKALHAWQNLRGRAEAAGVPLKLTSAYRSISYQRDLFNARLKQYGVSAGQIALGQADGAINEILLTTAPPGFSRHHTGYTIDLACGQTGLHAFRQTSCHKWLSDNNYQVAKDTGWIPSYPEGVNDQGPEPESWEYVWVGTSMLRMQ